MGALTHNGEVLQRLPANASQINFDKTGTNLNSTQTENAIKEVNTKVNANAEDITQLKSGLTSKVECVTFSIDDVEYPAGRSGDFYANLPSQYASRTILSAIIYSVSKAIKPYITFVDNELKKVQYYTENSESSALTRTVFVTFIIV